MLTGASTLKFTIRSSVLLTVMLVFGSGTAFGQTEKEEADIDHPSVGVSKVIEQIVLPGSLLTHKPVDPSMSPLIVRVVNSFPHGDAFRYDISYFGMEAGDFDLRNFLIREDGSTTDDLPPIPVTVKSILDDGQVEPNELQFGLLSGLGGYWRLLMFGVLFWLAVLFALIFLGHRKKKNDFIAVAKPATLAERLKPKIEAGIAGKLSKNEHAELERMLFAFWQKRLKMQHLEPAESLQELRSHDESGPLLRQVEAWLHSPDGGDDVNLSELLKPYQNIDATEFDEDSIENAEVAK